MLKNVQSSAKFTTSLKKKTGKNDMQCPNLFSSRPVTVPVRKTIKQPYQKKVLRAEQSTIFNV